MTDFSRLMSGNADEFEALLLHSAQDDEPAEGAMGKVGLALGLGASAVAVAQVTTTLVTPAAVAGQGVVLAKQLGIASLAKWLGVGIAAGLVTGGAAHVVARVSSRATPPPAVVAPRVERSPSRDPASAPAAPAPLVVERLAVPSAALAVPAPPLDTTAAQLAAAKVPLGITAPPVPEAALTSAEPSSASSVSSAAFPALAPVDEPTPVAPLPPSSLGDEAQALDRVRKQLGAGNATQALAEIRRYRAKWPRGALAAEATLLRVDALLRSGNRSGAELEANRLIKRAPQSGYATRARALLGYTPR
jgi:hypothetical protein